MLVCTTDCFFEGRMWVVGEDYPGAKANKHFIEKAKFVAPKPPTLPASAEAKAHEVPFEVGAVHPDNADAVADAPGQTLAEGQAEAMDPAGQPTLTTQAEVSEAAEEFLE